MIYRQIDTGEPLDQGDILDGCPILWIAGYDKDDLRAVETITTCERVIILTQTCDLANRKATAITVAVVRDAQALVEQHVVKASDIKGPIRAGRVWGWYFLPKSIELGVAEMIVDLRQLHTVRLDLLTALCLRGQRRGRLQPLYREHLAKHFADTYSRIGLPEPYPTD